MPRTSLQAWAGILVVCAAMLAASATIARRPSFTLRQVLSAPFPSDLVAAPAAGGLAWVFDDRGARNVWVADRRADGSARSRAVTRYAGDDGSEIGQLSWSPTTRRLFYTRGGSLEGGPAVNTQSLASGSPPQMVWSVGLDGGEPRPVGPGNAPLVSPAGDVVAFLAQDQVWTAPVRGGAPSQLLHDRGTDSALAWSPDGSRLAFTSTRAGHSIVGVFDRAAQRIVWMAPSVDLDRAPEWSPDGSRIAMIRIAAGTEAVDFTAHRDGAPWSIWVCDPRTGAGRAIWSAQPGRGSLFDATDSDRVLMWAAGDRLVFPWERTGWLHFFAVPASGGVAQELTTGGSFEVFDAALSPDRTQVVYSANSGDIDRRHLWSVPVAGGTPRQLTQGAGIEDTPVLAADGRLFAVRSGGRDPVRPVEVVRPGGSMADLAPGAIPPDFPAARLTQPLPVIFHAADGLPVHGQLFLPPQGRPARGPAILFFHGGPFRQMLPAWHPMDAYTFMYGFNEYLAGEGYVVLSVNYRGSIGYGLDFREAPGFGAGGASELNDITGAALFLGKRPDVDPGRIGIWGGSYGGLMTALGLARASNLIAAGADYAGVHDWRTLQPELSAPDAPPGAARLAYDSSAVATMDRWRSPVLVAHADDDRNVPFSQSIELVRALRQHHVRFEQLVLPDEVHDLLRAASWLTLFEAVDSFFDRYLLEGPVSEPGRARRDLR